MLFRLPLRLAPFLLPKVKSLNQVRKAGSLLPPTQYDVPIPRKLHLMYALKTFWEIIPLFIVTCTSLSFMVLSIAWAIKNKVFFLFSLDIIRFFACNFFIIEYKIKITF